MEGSPQTPQAEVGARSRDALDHYLRRIKPLAELAGLLALVAIPVFALKLILLARFDQTVALALIANITLGGTAVAILVTMIPVLFAAAGVLTAGRLGFGLGSGGRNWWGVVVVLALVGAQFVVWNRLIVCITYSVLIGLVFANSLVQSRLQKRALTPLSDADRRRLAKDYLSPGHIAGLALISIFVSPWWMPPERLVIQNEPTSALVLNDSDKHVAIFDLSKHLVLHVEKSKISDRQYCQPADEFVIWRASMDARPVCPGDIEPF